MLVKVIMELIYILYVCDDILTRQKHFKAVIRVKLIIYMILLFLLRTLRILGLSVIMEMYVMYGEKLGE